MAGNTIGVLFQVTTWGESHGPALGAVIDGCPPRIDLSAEEIERELARRRPGSAITSSRREDDRVVILSGVWEGKTLGTPISLLVWNRDTRSEDYEGLRDVYRPGHGDVTYDRKYGIRDHRGGGRASGRETVARVAAGAVAAKVLRCSGIDVYAFTRELGGVSAREGDRAQIDANPLYCPDEKAAEMMLACLDEARKNGDTLGGVVEIRVTGCPAGLGDPVFDRLDATLAYALMGIGTVKGVEIGAGFAAARMTGKENNDPLTPGGFLTNNAGGILAGISTGQDIVIRIACKPISSIGIPQTTITKDSVPVTITIAGRHDVCVIPRIVPVCEAMVRIVLVDHLLRYRALKNDD